MLPTMALPAALSCLAGSLPWSAWAWNLGEITSTVCFIICRIYLPSVSHGALESGGPAGLAALAGMFIYDQVISSLGDGSVPLDLDCYLG